MALDLVLYIYIEKERDELFNTKIFDERLYDSAGPTSIFDSLFESYAVTRERCSWHVNFDPTTGQ